MCSYQPNMKIFNAMKTPTLNIVCAEHIESTTNRAMVQASAQSGDIVRVFSEGLAHEECWGILRECIFGGRNEWGRTTFSRLPISMTHCVHIYKEPMNLLMLRVSSCQFYNQIQNKMKYPFNEMGVEFLGLSRVYKWEFKPMP